MKKIKKEESLKIAFIISWLPLVLVLILSVWSALFGVTFMFDKVYGWDAFALTIIAYSFFISPMLIAGLAYQIFYVTYRIIKMK